jgi:hypothetical protein
VKTTRKWVGARDLYAELDQGAVPRPGFSRERALPASDDCPSLYLTFCIPISIYLSRPFSLSLVKSILSARIYPSSKVSSNRDVTSVPKKRSMPRSDAPQNNIPSSCFELTLASFLLIVSIGSLPHHFAVADLLFHRADRSIAAFITGLARTFGEHIAAEFWNDKFVLIGPRAMSNLTLISITADPYRLHSL